MKNYGIRESGLGICLIPNPQSLIPQLCWILYDACAGAPLSGGTRQRPRVQEDERPRAATWRSTPAPASRATTAPIRDHRAAVPVLRPNADPSGGPRMRRPTTAAPATATTTAAAATSLATFASA